MAPPLLSHSSARGGHFRGIVVGGNQADVNVPDWGRETLALCASGVEWFSAFEVGGEPDLAPRFSFPDTPTIAEQEGAGCVTVALDDTARIAIRTAVAATDTVEYRCA